MTNKKSEASKLTKHTFLDKIKNTAANIDAKKTKVQNKQKADNDAKEDSVGKWDALKDDFMMNPKKVREAKHSANIAVLSNVLVCNSADTTP